MSAPRLPSATLRRLPAALEILHDSLGPVPFPERLFAVLREFYQDSIFSFELFESLTHTASQHVEAPVEARRLSSIMARIAKWAPLQHPAFPVIACGKRSPLRLSDLISTEKLRRTDLYHEAYKLLDVRYQLVLPLSIGGAIGGVTISRGTRDYTEADLALAAPLLRHIALAFQADSVLRAAEPSRRHLAGEDWLPLRRAGLTSRESEVLWWIGQGKRDAEIARLLGISQRTVNHHVHAILRKLGTETRTAAAAMLSRLMEGGGQ